MRTSGASAALAAVLAAVALVVGGERAGAVSTCSTSQLVPALGETLVSQGAPGYVRLARGKNTLVKFFLRSPTACAMASTQSIKITGATLTINNGQQPAFTGIQAFTPFSSSPLVTAGVTVNSPADPVFQAPAADLAPPAGTNFNPDLNTFNAVFTTTVTYARIDGRTTTSGLTATFTTSATFEHRTRAARLLVVPMGDGSASASGITQYTSEDQQATVNGLATLDRILSVPSGIGGLGATTPTGVHYVINTSALINLKDPSVPSTAYVGGYFCGTQASWTAIKGLLETYLNAWNRVLTNPPADRVVGVVGESISHGNEYGCAEGMASAVSHTVWVRARSDKPASGKIPAQPSLTGAAMAMELQHSWGQVPSPRSATLHSSNVRPNPTILNRSYNADSMTFVANDHSAMKFDTTVSPPWDNTNTFDEPADFAYSSCVFGGPTPTAFNECTGAETPGTLMGVATGHAFIASGTTNNTLAGTKVLWSQGIGQIQLTPVEPESRYRYVRRMATGVATNIGFHVSFSVSEHDDGHIGGDEVTSNIGQFGFALDDDIPPPGQDLATVQLWKLDDGEDPATDPDGTNATLLYERHQQTQGPQVRALSVTGLGGEENFSDNPDTDDVEPALSPDAQLLAWMEDSSGSTGTCDGPCHLVKVKPTAGGAAVYAPSNGFTTETIQPAWSPSGDELAYVVNGTDIYKVTVSFTGGSITFGTLTPVYTADFDNGKLPASHPTWSGDGSEIAFESGGNIWRIKVDGTGLTPLTDTGTAAQPSWSHTSGDDRIVFDALGDTSSDLYTLDPNDAEPVPQLLVNDGFEPYWTTSGTIAFHRATSVWAVKSDGTGQTKLFDAAGWPTIENGYTAFQRFVGAVELGGNEEIILVRPASAKRTVTWEATGPGAEFFVSALYFRCGGYDYPVNPSVSPIGFTSTVARFRTDFDPSGACGAGGRGDLYAVATNGVQTGGDGTGDPIVTIDSPPKDPRSVISYPLEDTYRQDASFSLLGNGFSANNQALPTGNLTWSVDRGYTATFGGSSLVLKAPAGGWPVGPLTFTLRVTEGSRSATTTRTVHILYDFVGGGFLPPVKNPPQVNTGNTGGTFPLKWQLKNANGGYIRSLATVAKIEYQSAGPGCNFASPTGPRTALPTGGSMLRYATSNEQFVYNWTLPTTPGCYVLTLTLVDDSEHQAWVVVSK
jgi:hypothetical protein